MASLSEKTANRSLTSTSFEKKLSTLEPTLRLDLRLWATLRMFWEKGDADAWSDQTFDGHTAKLAGKETVANMISLHSSKYRTESGDGYGPFARRDTNGSQLLKSGHGFIMSTDDPVNKPLPDPRKLYLHVSLGKT